MDAGRIDEAGGKKGTEPRVVAGDTALVVSEFASWSIIASKAPSPLRSAGALQNRKS